MKMSKMKKNRKKLFAILLQAALVSTAMTMPAYAAKTPGIGSDALVGDDATGPVLTGGNTVAVLDELYLWLSNPVAIEYIRNCLKRVRKRDSALVMASQNLEDFDQEGVREMTKPLFAIPPHKFLFNSIWICCNWMRRSLNSSSGQGVASAYISAAWSDTIWR